MPWKHDGKIISVGSAWTETIKTPPGNSAPDVQIQHPSNWALWSDDEKKDRGLTWEDPPASYDNRFYWSAGIEKRLADSSDGTIGLKTVWINKTKDTANDLLRPSDWYVTRKAEKSTAIPSDITKYRNDVRTACNTIETKIKAASDMTAFKKLFDSALDSKGTTTINNWPEEV